MTVGTREEIMGQKDDLHPLKEMDIMTGEKLSGTKFKNPGTLNPYALLVMDRRNLPPSLLFRKQNLETVKGLAYSIGNYLGYTKEELLAKGRADGLPIIRFMGMYVIKKKYGSTVSLHTVAQAYGKDHATVIHGMKTIQNMMDTDKEFERKIRLIQAYYG